MRLTLVERALITQKKTRYLKDSISKFKSQAVYYHDRAHRKGDAREDMHPGRWVGTHGGDAITEYNPHRSSEAGITRNCSTQVAMKTRRTEETKEGQVYSSLAPLIIEHITMATGETNSESRKVDRLMVNAKALWESLERKYKTEDAGSKKFVVGKFLDFKMVDSKTAISQVQEFQLILHDIHAEGMVLGKSFQVAALIEKLPPTRKDFKNYLKHKHKEMKLEDLIVRLRIEEDNRQSKKKAGNYHQEAKANVVEQEFCAIVLVRRVCNLEYSYFRRIAVVSWETVVKNHQNRCGTNKS
ncbi:hypothetical protein RJ639_019228 [Escallonia herrerae]|uniref:Uncharacterized protein n=1 Tax=Escallonia herrerae TaxID=1293975 RepID=A0AA88V926_9ASTE|nr:hypothetical protein RJ639_019228 [Escallonia herrerae]